jgi:hypothetical protein
MADHRKSSHESAGSSVADTNDMLYQSMMHNRRVEEKNALASAIEVDRSINESRASKIKNAEDSVSVITSSTSVSYATNSRYIEINSGKDRHIDVSHVLHPLSPDECDVYTSLVSATKGGGELFPLI